MNMYPKNVPFPVKFGDLISIDVDIFLQSRHLFMDGFNLLLNASVLSVLLGL